MARGQRRLVIRSTTRSTCFKIVCQYKTRLEQYYEAILFGSPITDYETRWREQIRLKRAQQLQWKADEEYDSFKSRWARGESWDTDSDTGH